MLKFRDRPCEAPIVCRAPNRSTRVTWRPLPASCHAVAEPIAPPPTTTVSRRAAMGPVSPSASFVALVCRRGLSMHSLEGWHLTFVLHPRVDDALGRVRRFAFGIVPGADVL